MIRKEPSLKSQAYCSAYRPFFIILKKLLFPGQALTISHAKASKASDKGTPWHIRMLAKYRRLISVAIPFLLVQVVWWTCAVKYDFWKYFPDKYFMSITMVFGSLIAG